jgi:hypothetical protein
VMWGKKVVLRLTNCVPVQLTETVEDQKSWQYTTVQEMWMNGETGMTKLKATFCSFANTPMLSGTMNCYECLANNKSLLSLLWIFYYSEAALSNNIWSRKTED